MAAAGLPALGTTGITYHTIIGGATNGSCGATHYLSANESKVLDWQCQTCPNGRFDSTASGCKGPGVVAHEMGHNFSLPHCDARPTCTPSAHASIMYNWPASMTACLAAEDRGRFECGPVHEGAAAMSTYAGTRWDATGQENCYAQVAGLGACQRDRCFPLASDGCARVATPFQRT